MTVDTPRPRCGCGKALHASQGAALRAAVADPDRAARPYTCPDGLGWHVSSRTTPTRQQRTWNDQWTTDGERFRRLVDRDIRLGGALSGTDLTLLYDRPLLWLATLHQVLREIQNHISTDRIELAAEFEHGRTPDSALHAEYLRAKAVVDRRNQIRRDVEMIVRRRIDHVKSLLPDDPLDRAAATDTLEQLIRVLGLLDAGDIPDATNLLRLVARRLGKTLTGDTPTL